jgi:putative resolvase
MLLKEHQYLSIGQAAKYLGLSVPTLRRYEKSGKLIPCFRTFGFHRRYAIKNIRKLIHKENNLSTVCYARVSTHDQKKDLITQVDKLTSFCKNKKFDNILVIQDLGSGLNFKKKGFKQLLNLILNKQCQRLVLNHKDRLLRFGSEIIFQLCQYFGVEVIIIEEHEESFEQELVSSVLEIITVFSSKLYGKRSHKNKQSISQTT